MLRLRNEQLSTFTSFRLSFRRTSCLAVSSLAYMLNAKRYIGWYCTARGCLVSSCSTSPMFSYDIRRAYRILFSQAILPQTMNVMITTRPAAGRRNGFTAADFRYIRLTASFTLVYAVMRLSLSSVCHNIQRMTWRRSLYCVPMMIFNTMMSRTYPTLLKRMFQPRYEARNSVASVVFVSPTRRSMVGLSVESNFT